MFSSYFQMPFWGTLFLGNTLKQYVFAAVGFLVFLLIFKVLQALIIHRLKAMAQKTVTDIDDTLIEIVNILKPPFYSFLAFYLAVQFLTLEAFVQKFINAALIILITAQIVIAAQILIDYLARRSMGKERDKGARAAVGVIKILVKVGIWIGGVLTILSNLGINITSLIAGLGIGGIAVALALQNILSDLFSSFSIFFDKPFEVGDFVIVGEHMGIVEKIGIKTTRLRALQGEEIVIANRELTSARIQNFKKMSERRVVFTFGVTYETPSTQLKTIPETVKKIIASIELVRFDRAHFKQFDDSALTFEVVYHVGVADYNQYMDVQQEINLRLKDALEQQSVSMAYPTQTVYLRKE